MLLLLLLLLLLLSTLIIYGHLCSRWTGSSRHGVSTLLLSESGSCSALSTCPVRHSAGSNISQFR